MEVTIVALEGGRFTVEVPVDATVDELKRLVEGAGGPPVEQQKLVCKGKPLMNGVKLNAAGVSPLCAGGVPKLHLVRLEKPNNPQVVVKEEGTGRMETVALDRQKTLTVGDLRDCLREKDRGLADGHEMHLPGRGVLADDEMLAKVGLAEGGTVMMIPFPTGAASPYAGGAASSAPPSSDIAPDLYNLLAAQSLLEYAPDLSRSGIRTLALLSHSEPSDLPSSLPNPVKRLLISLSSSAPPCPSAPPLDCTPCTAAPYGPPQ